MYKIKPKNLVLITTLLLFYSIVITQETKSKKIYVTEVKKTGDLYSITLNNLIIIKEIKLKTTKIGTRTIVNLEFPTYISKRGKAYPQITLLNKELSDKILSIITSMKPETMPSSYEPTFKLGKYSPYRRSKSSLKVFASVIFEDVIEIECKIMEGKRGPWIAWPARKDESTGKWKKQVVFVSKEYQQKVEEMLLNKYKTAVLESREE